MPTGTGPEHRDSPTYRRRNGEASVVDHGGRGWRDAGSTANNDVFALVPHLRPDLDFGHPNDGRSR